MIRVKIEWGSVYSGNPTEGDPFDGASVKETERRKSLEGIKEFNNEKEMLDYAYSIYDGEIIVTKGNENEKTDYEIELYNWYRE